MRIGMFRILSLNDSSTHRKPTNVKIYINAEAINLKRWRV